VREESEVVDDEHDRGDGGGAVSGIWSDTGSDMVRYRGRAVLLRGLLIRSSPVSSLF
jgi:hypothetical protein